MESAAAVGKTQLDWTKSEEGKSIHTLITTQFKKAVDDPQDAETIFEKLLNDIEELGTSKRTNEQRSLREIYTMLLKTALELNVKGPNYTTTIHQFLELFLNKTHPSNIPALRAIVEKFTMNEESKAGPMGQQREYLLGRMHLGRQWDAQQNIPQGLFYLLSSATKGYQPAIEHLQNMRLTQPDFLENHLTLSQLGNFYAQAVFIENHKEIARNYLESGTQSGNLKTLLMLAEAYRDRNDGLGIKQDALKSQAYFNTLFEHIDRLQQDNEDNYLNALFSSSPAKRLSNNELNISEIVSVAEKLMQTDNPENNQKAKQILITLLTQAFHICLGFDKKTEENTETAKAICQEIANSPVLEEHYETERDAMLSYIGFKAGGMGRVSFAVEEYMAQPLTQKSQSSTSEEKGLANYFLGVIQLGDHVANPDPVQALEYFRQSVECGMQTAIPYLSNTMARLTCYQHSVLHQSSKSEVGPKLALHYLQEGARANEVECLFALGKIYLQGDAFYQDVAPVDIQKGLGYLIQAANLPIDRNTPLTVKKVVKKAAFLVATYCQKNPEVTIGKESAAMVESHCLHIAAHQEHKEALWQLGNAYLTGDKRLGIKQDLLKGIDFLERLAQPSFGSNEIELTKAADAALLLAEKYEAGFQTGFSLNSSIISLALPDSKKAEKYYSAFTHIYEKKFAGGFLTYQAPCSVLVGKPRYDKAYLEAVVWLGSYHIQQKSAGFYDPLYEAMKALENIIWIANSRGIQLPQQQTPKQLKKITDEGKRRKAMEPIWKSYVAALKKSAVEVQQGGKSDSASSLQTLPATGATTTTTTQVRFRQQSSPDSSKTDAVEFQKIL